MSERSIGKFWYVSPLTRRILAVNVAALLALAAGMLVFGLGSGALVEARLSVLHAEARLAAASGTASPGLVAIMPNRPAPQVTVPPFLFVPGLGDVPPAAGSGVEQWIKNLKPGETRALRHPGGGLLLMAAVARPGGRVLVLLDPGGHEVIAALRRGALGVLRIFAFSLALAFLFTIYLSETVVHPLTRLSAATDRVRQSLLNKDTIPDLSWRRDEIGDLSLAFREMTAALEARMDAISRFAADVAHEIKNPLASVQSAIETFSVVKDEGRREQLLAVMADDVSRLNRLVTDISNASRLDADLSRAERAPLDLSALLQGVAEAERSRSGRPERIALYIEEGRRLPVTGNESQLAQVAHNLIDNALSFASDDGLVTVSAGLKGDKVYVHVDNPGPPIPEDKLEAVFERFYTSRPRGEKYGLHSGLGLSICRQVVRAHRGEITASNLKDKSGHPHGVRFTVLLPAGAGTK